MWTAHRSILRGKYLCYKYFGKGLLYGRVTASFDAESEYESFGSDAEEDSGDIMRMPVHHVQR